MESSLARHGAIALKGTESNSGNFTRENIWFNWGNSEEHTVRLVGDFKWVRSHWVGESQFGQDITILNPKAFKGENKIPMSVACGNWDADTESEEPGGDNCPVCRLGKNADKMLRKYGQDMDESDKEIIKSIRRKCAVKNTYMFKCIDRDDPYVDDEKTIKGYKIIKMPAELLTSIIELSKKMHGVNITSPDEGIDITIRRARPDGGSKGKGKMTYTALPVMEGMQVKQTPLTDEEKAYHDLDLSKFAGRPVDTDRFESELVDENNVRTIYESSNEAADVEEDDGVPF